MKRMISQDLIRWKNKKRRKPLLLTGVRQCGKTYSLQEFGRNEFDDCAYFNFEKSEGLSEIFEHDFDVKRIIDELGAIVRGKKIIPGITLVIFDEIQACPRAITSLKYFYEDMPELHVIGAGSLLGVALNKEGLSFPVGKVDRMQMYPMDFREFVMADGGEKVLNALGHLALERKIPDLITEPMQMYLKNYFIIGGMPEVVQDWIDDHDYNNAEEIQDQILADYRDDFGKYASPDTTKKISLIWDSIPVQIARENNKFVFSHVKTGARAKDLEDALQWLVNAGLVYKLDLVSTPEIPLSGMADASYFKVYMADVGLLRRRSNINRDTILNPGGNYIHFKGALAENYVLSQLKTMNIDSYFWRSRSTAELDFLTDYDGELIPIEVKSADNTKAKSLHSFCHRYEPRTAFESSLRNVGGSMDGKTKIWSLPLYDFFRLKEYIEQ